MNTDGTGFYICKECHQTESLWNHITTDHKEEEQWKTEETWARAVVTLETEQIKGSNPWCLWWWKWCLTLSKMLKYFLVPNLIFSIMFSIASYFEGHLHYWFAWHCSIYISFPNSFLLLNVTLVRSQSEYSSVACNSVTLTAADQPEGDQQILLSTYHIRFFSHLKPCSKFLENLGLRVHTLILREFTFLSSILNDISLFLLDTHKRLMIFAKILVNCA